ncbi:MAG: hypothetical protein LBS44_00995, partial [Deltaproteobacteria bacterium]|nr:hypothetical protein [Deltaproteobacteria bacterium]
MTTDDTDKTISFDDDLKIELDSQITQDLSLDAPDLEPASTKDNSPLKSQAVKDLENLDPSAQSDSEVSPPVRPIVKDKPAKKDSNEPRGYGWFFVHLFSLLGLVAWAVSAFLTSLPYRWEAALIALAVIVLTIPTMKTFHVRTRAGLAALGAAIGLAVCALYNPDTLLLPGVPLAFVWLLILSITWIWLIVSILRHEDLKKNKVALILSAILIYPLLAPIFAIVDGLIINSLPVSDFTLKYLNESPEFLTIYLPWFFWPQTFMAFLIPPLAAVFLLRLQLRNKKQANGKYHLGALWLALAGFVVLIFSLFSLKPISEDYPSLVTSIRDLWPAASQYQLDQAALAAKAAPVKVAKVQKPAASPNEATTTTPAPVTQDEAGQNPTDQSSGTDNPAVSQTETAPAVTTTDQADETKVASVTTELTNPTGLSQAPLETSATAPSGTVVETTISVQNGSQSETSAPVETSVSDTPAPVETSVSETPAPVETSASESPASVETSIASQEENELIPIGTATQQTDSSTVGQTVPETAGQPVTSQTTEGQETAAAPSPDSTFSILATPVSTTVLPDSPSGDAADVSKEVSQAASQTVTSLSPSDTAKPDPVVKESPTDTFV